MKRRRAADAPGEPAPKRRNFAEKMLGTFFTQHVAQGEAVEHAQDSFIVQL